MASSPEPPFPWMKDKPDTYQFHLNNDTGDFETYVRNKRLDLGESLLKQRRVYLDTKYWIHIRDVYLNRAENSLHKEILDELKRLRSTGSTICPISYSIFSELLYQSDPVTRKATAEMIDELSDDCTIQPLFEVFKRELIHFVTKCTKPNTKLFDISQMVWTKATFVLGDVFLSLENSPLPQKQAVAMQKCMDDLFWSTKLSEMLDALPLSDGKEQANNARLADAITAGKFENQNESDTFDKLFLDEVTGVVDAFADIMGDLMVYLAQERGMSETPSMADALQGGKMLGYLVRAAFEHKKLTTELPTVSIPASLHAAVRLDKKRKFKKGDFEDFHHATLAVPYFDVFLTESSLQHLLRSKDIDAEKKYGCTVLSTAQEVLNHLKTLS